MIDSKILLNALRKNYRFVDGDNRILTIEDLFVIPIAGKRGIESVAQVISSKIKESDGDTFFVSTPNKNTDELKEKLEIVKFIGTLRLEEKQQSKRLEEEKLTQQQRKQYALEELNRRQNKAITELNDEELKKLVTD